MDSGSHSLPQAAIGILNSIMGSLYGSLGSTSVSYTSDLALEEGKNLESNREEDMPGSCNLCTEGPANLQQPFNIEEERAPPFTSDRAYPQPFKQFDMVTGCLDHHFVDGAGKGLTLSQVNHNPCTPFKSWLMHTTKWHNWFLLLRFSLGKKRLVEKGSARMEHAGGKSSWYVILC